MRAYFTEGEAIGDREVLLRLAAEAGLDADEARAVLDGDRYTDEVRADEHTRRAHRHPRRPVLRPRPPLRRLGAQTPTSCSRPSSRPGPRRRAPQPRRRPAGPARPPPRA